MVRIKLSYGKVEALLFALIIAGCIGYGCAGMQPSPPDSVTLQPTNANIADYAGAWLGATINNLAINGPGAVEELCQAGVFNTRDCQLAKLGAGIGAVVLPSVVSEAQVALDDFKNRPSTATQVALSDRMAKVYPIAVATTNTETSK